MNDKLLIFKRLLIIILTFSTMIIYPMFSPKRGGVVSDSLSPRRNQIPELKMKECGAVGDIASLYEQSEESEQKQPSSDQIKPKAIVEVCEHLEHETEFSKFFLIVLRSNEQVAYKICCNSIIFPSGDMCCKELFDQMFNELIKDGFQEIIDPAQDHLGISAEKQSIMRLIKFRGALVERVVDLFCLFNQSTWRGLLDEPTNETFPNSIILDRPTLWKSRI